MGKINISTIQSTQYRCKLNKQDTTSRKSPLSKVVLTWSCDVRESPRTRSWPGERPSASCWETPQGRRTWAGSCGSPRGRASGRGASPLRSPAWRNHVVVVVFCCCCFKAILLIVLIVYDIYLIDLLVYKCMSVTLLCTIFYVYIWTCLSEINSYIYFKWQNEIDNCENTIL